MRVHLHPQGRTLEFSGRRSVGRLLAELGMLPGTVMVIRGDLLLLDGEMVEDGDDVEVRAVISGGTMKCTRCRAKAEVSWAHNAGFCRPCYLIYFRRQVERASPRITCARTDERAGRRLGRRGQPGAGTS
jgi:sulfur carrier protein ThiS